MNISLLGTGLLGSSMAERLLSQGLSLCVYNRTFEKTKALTDQGAKAVESPAEAIAFGNCIICVLSDVHAIEELLLGDESVSLNDKTIIQMGTIAPQESIDLQKTIFERGGEYFECPVLGSRPEAREGNLILFVGSSREKFANWSEFLKYFGPNPRYVGDVGSAAAFKLALNQLIVNHAIGFSVSLGLVQSYGLDVDQFMGVLRESSLYAPMFDKKLAKWMKRDYENPNFPTKHLLKDLELVTAAAQEKNINTEHLEAMKNIIEKTLGAGLDSKDYSSVYEVIYKQ